MKQDGRTFAGGPTHFFVLTALGLVSLIGIVSGQTVSKATKAGTQGKTVAHGSAPSSPAESQVATPPGYSTERTGTMHDFDYFVGGWTTHQRRLKVRGLGSNDWEESSGNLCMSLYLDGMATVDEIYFPVEHTAGLTLRAFDSEKHQWSIYWVSSVTGRLDPVPVVGGFDGDQGEFYAEDRDNGHPIKVRYSWMKLDHDHARWEQAFSCDNQTWETNWTADFNRAGTANFCDGGRPKR